MSKWYEVKIITIQVVMVEVADDKGEDEAFALAEDFKPFDGDTEFEMVQIDTQNKHSLDNYIRHADEVVYLKDYAEEE